MEKEQLEQNLYEGALKIALKLKTLNKDKYTQLMLKLMGKLV